MSNLVLPQNARRPIITTPQYGLPTLKLGRNGNTVLIICEADGRAIPVLLVPDEWRRLVMAGDLVVKQIEKPLVETEAPEVGAIDGPTA